MNGKQKTLRIVTRRESKMKGSKRRSIHIKWTIINDTSVKHEIRIAEAEMI